MSVEHTPEVPAEEPKLSFTDLTNLSEIIRVAQSRGAFKAEEMSQVGAVFDNLNKFLALIAANNKAAEEAAAAAKEA